jgi:ferrous iron transport protein B
MSSQEATALGAAPPTRVILVGPPNVGKSALFGALTGRYATVSNYPGTTVEITRAQKDGVEFIDTPGTDSLLPNADDARVTRDILLGSAGATVLVVGDAKNLRRALLLVAQLAEGGARIALVLNMTDEAEARGIRVDAAALSIALGIPVVETIATRGRGVSRVAPAIERAAVPRLQISYGPVLEEEIARVQRALPQDSGLSPRALAVMLLGGDGTLPELPFTLCTRVRLLQARCPNAIRQVIAKKRLAAVEPIVGAAQRRPPAPPPRGWLSRLTTHPVYGLPLLALVLLLSYEFVGVLGAQTCVDLLERALFRERLTPMLAEALRGFPRFGAWLAGENGVVVGRYGLFSMGLAYGLAIVLPIVATFFIAFGLLEDSGYLPRLAVMLNRAFNAIGLNGKAVLPMVLGLGCDTMATVTTRVLESKKERILVTLLLALAVPCSAQLAVILAMLGVVRPSAAAWLLVTLFLVLVAVGWIAARVVPGKGSDFVLELPPLRAPSPGNVLIKTVARVEWYLREALPLFVLGTAILQLLDRTGALASIERAMRPLVVGLLQLPPETASAFLLGFLRRDYAAAGLFAHYQPYIAAGKLTPSMEVEIVVALVTVTLFLPCVANFIMLLKERGAKVGLTIAAFVMPFAFGAGALVNVLMRRFYL